MLRNYPCNPQRFFSDGRRRRCIPLCCEGALLLTPCFLALALAVLPLLLPHLLAFLPLLLPDLLALLALLLSLPPLLLRTPRLLLPLLLLGSRISLLWVRSTSHAVLPLVGFCTFAL